VVDATVFRHDGRWWLLGSVHDGADANSRLDAWYADALRGPWTPHPLNPLKCDVRSSRSAGTPFTVDGCLYRPAQDCAHTYGGAVSINRIDELTPSRFVERTVTRIAPDPDGPYPAGLHTICAAGPRTIIDGKREDFSWLAWLAKLRWERASAARRSRSAISTRGNEPRWEPELSRVPSTRRGTA
jgi:hypothetical protein